MSKSSGSGTRGGGRPSTSPVWVVVAAGLAALVLAGMSTVVTSAAHGLSRNQPVAAASPHPTKAPGRLAAVVAPSFGDSWLHAHPQASLDIKGEADALVDVDTDQVLWVRSAHQQRAPASLAKLVTAMVAADLAPLDKEVTVTSETDADAVRKVEPASTLMGLTAGEKLTVGELMYGLFLRSGNDAAETLGGTIVPRDRFIELMNAKAAQLHMTDSHFVTPVGLDDPQMRMSAYDLAIAAATITARYPALLAISGTASKSLPQTATHKAFDMVNYNKLVLPGNQYTYQGATGMKTAFTDNAGPCMVATATRNGHRLVAVVLNSSNFFADAQALLNYGYSTEAQPAPTAHPAASPSATPRGVTGKPVQSPHG